MRTGKIKILHIEDDPDLVVLIERHLTRTLPKIIGGEVELVSQDVIGNVFELYSDDSDKQAPDLVICDIRLQKERDPEVALRLYDQFKEAGLRHRICFLTAGHVHERGRRCRLANKGATVLDKHLVLNTEEFCRTLKPLIEACYL